MVLELVLGLGLLLAPQGGEPAMRTDANGWPLPTAAEGEAASPERSSQAASGRQGEADGAGGPAFRADSLESPLREVWRAVGAPAHLAERGHARAEIALHLYDSTGARIATRLVRHEADLSVPSRDRLELDGGRKVYGRDGAQVWALIDNVVWHAREDEARQVLELMGLLLRAPWVFGSGRWRARPAEPVEVAGQPRLRIRIEPRAGAGLQLPGDAAEPEPAHRFALLCDPGTMRPEELHYRLAESGAPRRVQLLEYQHLPPDLQVPVRRVVHDDAGRRLLEIEILRMQCGVELDAARFRPPVRSGWAGPPR